jgi:hypothetical protein
MPHGPSADRAESDRRTSNVALLVYRRPHDGGMADTGLTGTAGRLADLRSSHP